MRVRERVRVRVRVRVRARAIFPRIIPHKFIVFTIFKHHPGKLYYIGGAGEWAKNGFMEFTVRITEICTVRNC